MQCRACSAEIPDGKRFCRMCGTTASVAAQPNSITPPSPVPSVSGEASDRKCKACRAPVKEGKRFCGGCDTFVSRFARLGLLGVLIIAGCASHGSEFLGK